MPSTTTCSPGDVVLVPFQFADSDRAKRRPAVVISVPEFHESRADAVMVALTSQPARSYFGDCEILDWKAAGLPLASTAKGAIRTVDRGLFVQRLGSLTPSDWRRLQQTLRDILGL